jgi:hypothetical protein
MRSVLGIKGANTWNARRSIPRMQGGGLESELGGIMEVAMWMFDIA